MKKVSIFVVIIAIGFSCNDRNESIRQVLDLNSLKGLLEKREDVTKLVDGVIQDQLVISGMDSQTKARIQEKANVLSSQYGSRVTTTDMDFIEFNKMIGNFSKNTIPSFQSILRYLSNYDYSQNDLEKVLSEIVYSKSVGSKNARVSNFPDFSSCEFRCGIMLMRSDIVGDQWRGVFYMGCMIGCNMN